MYIGHIPCLHMFPSPKPEIATITTKIATITYSKWQQKDTLESVET